MDTQPCDAKGHEPPVVQKPEIALLRSGFRRSGQEYSKQQAFVPREAKTPNGTTVFKTQNGAIYARVADGSIRRTSPKVNGKLAKRMRRHAKRN